MESKQSKLFLSQMGALSDDAVDHLSMLLLLTAKLMSRYDV